MVIREELYGWIAFRLANWLAFLPPPPPSFRQSDSLVFSSPTLDCKGCHGAAVAVSISMKTSGYRWDRGSLSAAGPSRPVSQSALAQVTNSNTRHVVNGAQFYLFIITDSIIEYM